HPIYRLALNTDVLDSDIEDIVLGGSGRKTRASSWTPNRIVSRDDLQKAKGTVEAVGLQGEQFVNNYLSMLKSQGKIQDFAWVADENVINPYDFWVSYDGKTKVLVDVKSTQGNFERTLHISLNELLRMRDGPEHYDIYRVFSMQEVTAQLRIAKNVGLWAEQILKVLEMLPEGVFSDGISLSPTILLFNSPDVLNIEELTEE
ncbi:MAG TPA: hypothetical protein DHW02_22195, partial [Ktedonobacter sp.]|nr:hypothetical protein [Ktedonobacter sp.]